MLCRVTFWSYQALESPLESDCSCFSPTTERKDLTRELLLHTFVETLLTNRKKESDWGYQRFCFTRFPKMINKRKSGLLRLGEIQVPTLKSANTPKFALSTLPPMILLPL